MDFDIRLVELVEKYDHLYNKSNRQFKNKLMKENSWEQIAKNMNSTAENVEKRWWIIRNRYSKEMKKKSQTSSGQASFDQPEWHLLDAMAFLNKHIRARTTVGNVDLSPAHKVAENEPIHPLNFNNEEISEGWTNSNDLIENGMDYEESLAMFSEAVYGQEMKTKKSQIKWKNPFANSSPIILAKEHLEGSSTVPNKKEAMKLNIPTKQNVDEASPVRVSEGVSVTEQTLTPEPKHCKPKHTKKVDRDDSMLQNQFSETLVDMSAFFKSRNQVLSGQTQERAPAVVIDITDSDVTFGYTIINHLKKMKNNKKKKLLQLDMLQCLVRYDSDED